MSTAIGAPKGGPRGPGPPLKAPKIRFLPQNQGFCDFFTKFLLRIFALIKVYCPKITDFTTLLTIFSCENFRAVSRCHLIHILKWLSLPSHEKILGARLSTAKMSMVQNVNEPKCERSKMSTTHNVNGRKCQRPKLSTVQNVNNPKCQRSKMSTAQNINSLRCQSSKTTPYNQLKPKTTQPNQTYPTLT